MGILTYAGTSSLAELVSDELKLILSEGRVPVGTLTTEKSVLAGRNSSDGSGILYQLSMNNLLKYVVGS